jgi:hypothetical protein
MSSLTEIRLRRASRLLEVCFSDGSRFELPFSTCAYIPRLPK